MLQVNPPIPRNIIAVLDALAELGKVVQEQSKTADSGNPGRETRSAAEQDNHQRQSGDEVFYPR